MGAGAASEKADSFEECPIRYSTGGEYNILSGREILGSVNILEVPEPHVLEPFLLIRLGHDQTRLHFAVETAQGCSGQHAFGRPADPHHRVNAGAQHSRRYAGRQVTVAYQPDSGACLSNFLYQVGMARAVE